MTTTRILYNEQCSLCRAEIGHYREKAERLGADIVFEDLHKVDLGTWQLTPDQAKRRMHAALPDGTIVSGIPAFAAIWRRMPGMSWMAWLVELPLIRQLADFAYNRVLAPWIYGRQIKREARGLAGSDGGA